MSKEVAPVEEFDPRMDQIIWRKVGIHSVRQIAEEIGVSPEKVLRRKRELMEEVDVLTVQEKRVKLISSLQEIADAARADYESAPMDFKAGLINSAVSAIKVVLVELNRTAKGEQEAIDRLNDLRVRELLALIDRTVYLTLGEISETYGLDEGELQDIFQRHLRPAAEELEA